jgi:hypothetical protein
MGCVRVSMLGLFFPLGQRLDPFGGGGAAAAEEEGNPGKSIHRHGIVTVAADDKSVRQIDDIVVAGNFVYGFFFFKWQKTLRLSPAVELQQSLCWILSSEE